MILKELLELINDKPPRLSKSIQDEKCCVCNGDLERGGLKFSKIFSKSTFNQNHFFKNMQSDYICSHCAVFFKKEYWADYCGRNRKNSCFPRIEGKKRFVANWVFFSHAFWTDKHEIVKDRHDWRDYLLNPPSPPFLFVISTLCKKHLIYRAQMSYCSNNYPVQFEEKQVYINKAEFEKCLNAFEKLYSQGLSKSTIVRGNYNSSALLKCDKKIFIENEEVVREFRKTNIDYLEICEFIGMKNE